MLINGIIQSHRINFSKEKRRGGCVIVIALRAWEKSRVDLLIFLSNSSFLIFKKDLAK